MAFIVFEGVDGSGKSSLMKNLSAHLNTLGVPVTTTREPGGTPLGEAIRGFLLKKDDKLQPTPLAEFFLYQACRRQNVDTVIKPALEKGRWVLSDRFWASTYAFQSGGRGLDKDKVIQTSLYASEGVKPDLWVLLDLSIEEARQRWEDRTLYQPLDRFEMEDISFHKKVYDYYKNLSQSKEYGPWLVLDATLSQTDLVKAVADEVKQRGWLK